MVCVLYGLDIARRGGIGALARRVRSVSLDSWPVSGDMGPYLENSGSFGTIRNGHGFDLGKT